MKYFYLFLFVVFLPLLLMYLYQRRNPNYANFTWNSKNRFGVWVATLLALFVTTAKATAPSFVEAINIGWQGGRNSSGEFNYCVSWLIALTLLIFPHLVKRSYWSINPTATEYYDRYNANNYWYAGVILLIFPVLTTWNLIK